METAIILVFVQRPSITLGSGLYPEITHLANEAREPDFSNLLSAIRNVGNEDMIERAGWILYPGFFSLYGCDNFLRNHSLVRILISVWHYVRLLSRQYPRQLTLCFILRRHITC